MQSKIKFLNVTKQFNNHSNDGAVLRDISFNIFAEEFVCVLGSSGSGKSTILGLIAGFIKPTVGEVLFNSKHVQRPDGSRTLVFQDYALFPWLNIQDNIAFGLTTKKHSKKQANKTALEYLELVGLLDYKDYNVSQISGGMKQRVAIARALAVDPEVLLLDEPFGALDQQTRESMQTELLRLFVKTKKTVVFVTHSVDEALKLADRVLVIGGKPGKLLLDTTLTVSKPRDFQDPRIVSIRDEILDKIAHTDYFMGADI